MLLDRDDVVVAPAAAALPSSEDPHDDRESLGESLDMAPFAAPTAALSIDVIPPLRDA